MTIWQLMKNLRDKWWIPRWYNEVIHTVYDKKHKIIWLYKEGKEYLELVYKKSLRDLCSKESWLWQFCIDNWMVRKNTMYYCYWNTKSMREFTYTYDDVVFWILQSSMINEYSLEQFLLDNIKVWNYEN